jgi:hypothetical protein
MACMMKKSITESTKHENRTAFVIFLDVVSSVSDPDSLRSVDPYPYLKSGSGSRRKKLSTM